MDIRLFESAQTGNVMDLHQLLRENPLILHTISLYSCENPLHVASAAGHVGFVREILGQRPQYAKEVNKDGFSPLHIAAANGHIEVVRELLSVDRKLCCLEGREKKTPLHLAAMIGRVDVITEMLLSCAECIEGVTVQGETALHLATKNSQFEAVKLMVDWIIEMKKEGVLNLKDEQGNTVLHLATWKKQRQANEVSIYINVTVRRCWEERIRISSSVKTDLFLVIELVLGTGTTVTSGLLEVNAVNQSGLTALDVLQIFPSEAGDREIADILQHAGAVRARDVMISPTSSCESPNQTPQRSQRQTENLVEYFKFKKGRDPPSEARSALLVIAVLVATATFQVGLSPPGGTWQDNSSPNQSNGTSIQSAYSAGTSIMGTSNGIAFALFVLFNSIGFSMSLFMINILTSKFPLQFELQICMIAMFFTYNTAMASTAPSSVKLFVIIITTVLSSITPLLTRLVKQLLKLLKNLVVDIIHKVT
ncbi:ankyrin repeat-containing protein BDA1 [Herrania umbratica]|uniref:Ankyrin repeat-containing protein BDA1 n=1 Tax=Herrania umbratica TaxID=108875 RepID=A0A6J1AJ97_9ROSI|nr:ankyrin repeat-containing protein BDA1 [Herrania umbratica]